MAFEQDKDKLIAKIGSQTKLRKEGKAFLRVRVFSYDGGDPKIAIQRVRIKKDGDDSFMRLGRLSLEEAEFVGRMFAKIPEKLPAAKVNNKKTSTKKTRPKSKVRAAAKAISAGTKKNRRKPKRRSGAGGW